jgi:SAM-dependent methyltransferase
MDDHHAATNRANWDNRATLHAKLDSGYKLRPLVEDKSRLSNVVSFDRPRLGDIAGQRAVHLQCHIGTDTLSLARLGANVTGLDFSGASIAAARDLVSTTGDSVEFVQADVYAARSALEGDFDLVYTGIGALCWLPDITEWARVVASLLAPGGRLFVREGHPILFAVDERLEGGPTLRFPYFNTDPRKPLEWDEDTTYVEVEGGEKLTATKSFQWNHGLGEIVTAVLAAGLVLEVLEEHDSVSWEAIPGAMEWRELDEWVLKEHSGCMPLTYTLVARKPAT